MLGKTNDELMRRYGEENTVTEKTVEKLVEMVAFPLSGIEIYISRPFSRGIRKRYLGGTTSARFCLGIVLDGPREVPEVVLTSMVESLWFYRTRYSLAEIGIYKRSFSSQGTVIIELAEA